MKHNILITEDRRTNARTFGKNRKCIVCGSILSIYNPDNICWVHVDFRINREIERARLKATNKKIKKELMKEKAKAEAKKKSQELTEASKSELPGDANGNQTQTENQA